MYSIPSAGRHIDSVGKKLLLLSVQVARVPTPLESSTTRAYNHVSHHPNFCWYFVHGFFTLKHTHAQTHTSDCKYEKGTHPSIRTPTLCHADSLDVLTPTDTQSARRLTTSHRHTHTDLVTCTLPQRRHL